MMLNLIHTSTNLLTTIAKDLLEIGIVYLCQKAWSFVSSKIK